MTQLATRGAKRVDKKKKLSLFYDWGRNRFNLYSLDWVASIYLQGPNHNSAYVLLLFPLSVWVWCELLSRNESITSLKSPARIFDHSVSLHVIYLVKERWVTLVCVHIYCTAPFIYPFTMVSRHKILPSESLICFNRTKLLFLFFYYHSITFTP